MSFWNNVKTKSSYESYHLADDTREFLVNLFHDGNQEVCVNVKWFVSGRLKETTEFASAQDSEIEQELEKAAKLFHIDKGYFPNPDLLPVPDKKDFSTLCLQAEARSKP